MDTRPSTSIIDINDVKAVWKIFVKNWYIIIILLALSYVFSRIYSHKLSNVYSAKTQILLKSNKTYDYQNQLYKGLGYYGEYEDVSNQMRVITSTSLIQKTLNKLNLAVSYFIIGRFKTTEVYENMPFSVESKKFSPAFFESSFNLKILDINTYQLSYQVNDDIITERQSFNQPFIKGGLYCLINRNPGLNEQTIKSLKNIDYQFVVHSPNYLISKYKSSLTAENLEWSAILEVSLKDDIPQRAVEFLDTLSKLYIENTLQNQFEINNNTIIYIEKQLQEVTEILDNIEDDLENFKKEKSILDLQKEQEDYFEKLTEFDSERRTMQLQLESVNALEDYIINSQDEKLLPPSFYILENDLYLKSTINELYDLQIQRNGALFNSTEKSPNVIELDKRLELLRNNLLTYIVNTKKAISVRINAIQKQIKDYEKIIGNLPLTQRQMLNIQRQQQVNEKMYLYLLEKKAETIIAKAGILAETTIIEEAHSVGIISPNKPKIIYTFLGVGLVLSLLIIFIRTVFFSRIESYDELKAVTNVPILGEILYSEAGKEQYIVVDADPKSPVTESFRSIRTNLEYMAPELKSKVVLITSNNPGEGKTFCSINLASIIAKAGKKVIIIELDLHKPKVHIGFNMSSDKGVSTILIGKNTPEETLLKTDIKNLDIILSGPIPPNASELILSTHLTDIINFGRANYDYVIIDTPPIGLISDALILMRFSDINLFVLNTKFTKKDSVAHAQELVSNNKTSNFGFILNGVKRRKSRYYYNRYSYGYGGYGYGDTTKSYLS